jgi:hypothetical protein
MKAVAVLMHMHIVTLNNGRDLYSNEENVFSCFFESDKAGHEVWSQIQRAKLLQKPPNYETAWIDRWISNCINWLLGRSTQQSVEGSL